MKAENQSPGPYGPYLLTRTRIQFSIQQTTCPLGQHFRANISVAPEETRASTENSFEIEDAEEEPDLRSDSRRGKVLKIDDLRQARLLVWGIKAKNGGIFSIHYRKPASKKPTERPPKFSTQLKT